MSQTIFDSIAMGYQPVWGRGRELAAVRLSVLTLHPEAVDARHLVQALGSHWPAAAPALILSLSSPVLLQQALAGEPVPNTWLEVPAAPFARPESLAGLAMAVRRGHRLLRRADLGALLSEAAAPLDVRSLLRLGAEDAFEALQARGTGEGPAAAVRPSPIRPGQLYEGVCNRALADHCLDDAGAWGLLGWPDEDVLHARRHQPQSCAAAVIDEVRRGIETDASLDHLERLVRQDPVMAYRLLLLVNSAAYGLRREIGSLRHALMMLGFTALDQWLAEQRTGSETDDALHPVRYAMVMHARLAQHLLEPGADDNLRAEVFLTALLGQLGRLLNQSTAEVLNRLPLSGRVFDALLRQQGPYQPFVAVAQAQADTAQLHLLPAVCQEQGISLEHANRALVRMLATSRDGRD